MHGYCTTKRAIQAHIGPPIDQSNCNWLLFSWSLEFHFHFLALELIRLLIFGNCNTMSKICKYNFNSHALNILFSAILITPARRYIMCTAQKKDGLSKYLVVIT